MNETQTLIIWCRCSRLMYVVRLSYLLPVLSHFGSQERNQWEKTIFSTFVREESESFIGFKCKIAYDFSLLLCIVLWDVTNNFTMPCAMHRTKFNSFSKATEWLSSGFWVVNNKIINIFFVVRWYGSYSYGYVIVCCCFFSRPSYICWWANPIELK